AAEAALAPSAPTRFLDNEFTFQECRTVGGSTKTRMPVTRRCPRRCRAGVLSIHPGQEGSHECTHHCSSYPGNCCRARCGCRPCRDHRHMSSACRNVTTTAGSPDCNRFPVPSPTL